MAKEFKIKKGLLVEGSGSTGDENLVDVQGNSGQLFSVTDSLVGSLFSVNDISGIPLLDVDSSGTVIGGISTTISTSTVDQGISGIYDTLNGWDTAYVSGEIMKAQPIGEAVAVGECLVLKGGFEWFKANPTNLSTSSGMLGIALQAASSGTVDILISGFVETTKVQSTIASTGAPMYLRESTAGGMSDTIPSSGIVRLVGYCYQNSDEHPNVIFILRFDPDNTWVEL
jgi:hypothetical protein